MAEHFLLYDAETQTLGGCLQEEVCPEGQAKDVKVPVQQAYAEELKVPQQAEEHKVPEAEEHKVPQAEERKVPQAEEHKVPQAEEHKVLQQAEERKVPEQAEEHKVSQAEEHKVPQAEEHKVLQQAEDGKVPQAEEGKVPQAEEHKVPQAEEHKVLQQAEDRKVPQAEEGKVPQAEEVPRNNEALRAEVTPTCKPNTRQDVEALPATAVAVPVPEVAGSFQDATLVPPTTFSVLNFQA